MSENVRLYSSHLITVEELRSVLLAVGGKPVAPMDKGFTLLGVVEEGKRHILISGDPDPKDDPQRFWSENAPYLGQEFLQEVQTKLGAKPVISLYVEIGHAPKSGLLAVRFAYQCALRWPCIGSAEVFEDKEWILKIYTKEDMERLLAEGQAFTTCGMDDDDDEDDQG